VVETRLELPSKEKSAFVSIGRFAALVNILRTLPALSFTDIVIRKGYTREMRDDLAG